MRGRLTVQGWQNLVLSLMGVVVIGGAIVGALLLNRTDEVSRELNLGIQPARVAAYQLQAALRDQETAVRGYAIAADLQFLDPYFEGQQVENEAARQIRDGIGHREKLLGDLEAIENAAADWRSTYADPLIASVTPGVPKVLDAATAERGKEGFDALRVLFDTQNRDLAQARQDAVDELASVQTWRDTLLITIIVAFFVAGIVLAVLVRKAVTRPLERLAASCRRTTEGNFDEKISVSGPRDIQAIASDVEDMRQRIVDELAASRSAREQLGEQALELQRSNAELEQFAYVASHDLQEPLRKVASFCQLIEKRYGDKLDERGVEYIRFAVDGAKRMQVLINDLLTFSRVGRLSATETDVDLDAVLTDAIDNLAASIEESGAEVVRTGEPLPTVKGDPTLLTMLWQNLIGNAVKFRRPDAAPRIVIDCAVGEGTREGAWLFTVTDNGIGIPEEFAEKVFVIFQRLHGREVYTGTGIGLALCKKIVEHHGGNIWIDTGHAEGTRFRFTIPCVVDDPVEAEMEGSTA
ncbi:histidine kinase [Mycolicibacterium novocastrense]|uniref:sensor histidine kinase n=1 Tax=Mycolicibacterium novocastrense TaxID=59813 RepID=UPI000747B907|nr:sensor histidine kinase [Mycolicibacterium novocastrense]KUH66124.1 histidine kinase [Mycolicibacterium novocastrense]KUH66606.1 histidine kinase [Mycolicibacterium novocastrense]KUH73946.1 histidine kinase [Mycolicibacterium novocastrense]